MPIVRTQGAKAYNGSVTLTLTGGECVVMAVFGGLTGSPLTYTVGDNQGNNYNQIVAGYGGSSAPGSIVLLKADNCAAGSTTFSILSSNSNQVGLLIDVYKGVKAGTPMSVTSGANAGTYLTSNPGSNPPDNINPLVITPPAGNILLFQAMAGQNNNTGYPDSTFNDLGTDAYWASQGNTVLNDTAAGYKFVTGGAPINVKFGVGYNGGYDSICGVVMALEEANPVVVLGSRFSNASPTFSSFNQSAPALSFKSTSPN